MSKGKGTTNPASGAGGSSANNSPTLCPHQQKYATVDEAAVAAMKAANPGSVKQHREFGGWIQRNADGTYTPHEATRGTKAGLENIPSKGADDVAWWHTHGSSDKGYDNENFSGDDGDKGYSKATNAVGYLATPSGVIKKYGPGTNSESVLGDTAPPK